MRQPKEKIRTIEEMKTILRDLEKDKKKYILTNGCFDILHLGHIRYLQKAKEIGDILIVAINSDSSVKKNKGPDRPILPQNERAEILSSLECVDYIFIFDDIKLDTVLENIKPLLYAKGGDYVLEPVDATPKRPAIVQSERKIIERYGGKIIIIPSEKEISTTNIIDSIIGTFKR